MKLFKDQTIIVNDAPKDDFPSIMDDLEELALQIHKDPEEAEKALTKAIFDVNYHFKYGPATSVTLRTKNTYDVEEKLIVINPIVNNGQGESRDLRHYKMDIIANLRRGATYDIKRGAVLWEK